jgi:hypothetical protein
MGGSSGDSPAGEAPAAKQVGSFRIWILDFWTLDFSSVPIRNFSIIAHIDHGKSTLADRLLQATHAVSAGARVQHQFDIRERIIERPISAS